MPGEGKVPPGPELFCGAVPVSAPSQRESSPLHEPEARPPAEPRWWAPMTGRELILSWGGLTLLGFLLFLPHILHGGLYLDDWYDAAGTLHPSSGSGVEGALSFSKELLWVRPVLVLFVPLKYLVFGTDLEYLMAISVVLAVLAACLVYAVLRVLNLPSYHAWLISALTIAYPWYDSTRLWESTNAITLAAVLAFAGIWMALVGLSRESWRLHAGAALLYLLSMLSYEMTLPFIAVMGIVYIVRNGWRAARLRWGVDLLMVVIAALWIRIHTKKEVSGLSDNLSHLKLIVTHGGELLARTLYPFGTDPHTSLLLIGLAAVLAAGIAAYVLLPGARTTKSGWGLHGWLLLGGGGLLLAFVSWAIFIPAHPYYTPSVFGVTNRVNGFAGFGLVIAAYAALGVVGYAAGRLAGGRSWMAAAATISLAVMLGAAYVHVLERHSRLWRDAYRYETVAMNRIHRTFPDLPSGTTLFAANYPANVTLGVPILTSTLDLKGMVQLTYEDTTLQAYPITEELALECLSTGMRLGVEDDDILPSRYGTARLIDLQTGRTSTPRGRRECRAEKPKYPPGPLYLATAY